MASVEKVKNIVEALISGDNDKAINLLQQEANKLRDAKRVNAYRDIKRLIAKIPDSSRKTREFGGATASSARLPFESTVRRSLTDEKSSVVTPEDVILNDSARESMASVFQEWEFADRLMKKNMSPTNRMLFYGPPGTGKTHLAHAVAYQLDLPILIVKLDELVSSHLGSTGKNIRDVFMQASERPSVLFLDEFDTLAKFRSDERELGELKRVVTVLLQHIDNFPMHSVLIAATNHEDILDKAVWRRFQLKVRVELPDKNSVKKIIKLYSDGDKHVDIELMSDLLDGVSGSDIREICISANKAAILNGKNCATTEDYLKVYLNYLNGHASEISKKQKYSVCQKLKDGGCPIKKIASVSGIPYTTLRDNLK